MFWVEDVATAKLTISTEVCVLFPEVNKNFFDFTWDFREKFQRILPPKTLLDIFDSSQVIKLFH